jgi:FtsZ-binding cell division protein ZapB
MITLEQIRLLEERVRRAVDRISALQEENGELRKKSEEYEARVGELEARIDRFTRDQNQIEDGIKKAIDSLEGIAEADASGETAPEVPAQESSQDEPGSSEDAAEQGTSEEPASALTEPTHPKDEEPETGSSVEETNELDIF